MIQAEQTKGAQPGGVVRHSDKEARIGHDGKGVVPRGLDQIDAIVTAAPRRGIGEEEAPAATDGVVNLDAERVRPNELGGDAFLFVAVDDVGVEGGRCGVGDARGDGEAGEVTLVLGGLEDGRAGLAVVRVDGDRSVVGLDAAYRW
jgi:hypothetical protein